jgi:recombination protein RecA
MAKKPVEKGEKPSKTAKLSKIEAVFAQNPNLKNAVAQIEKAFGEGALMPLGVDRAPSLSGIATGSLSLDIALGGHSDCADVPVGGFVWRVVNERR